MTITLRILRGIFEALGWVTIAIVLGLSLGAANALGQRLADELMPLPAGNETVVIYCTDDPSTHTSECAVLDASQVEDLRLNGH